MGKGNWYQLTFLTPLTWRQVIETIFSLHNNIAVAYMAERSVSEVLLIERIEIKLIRLTCFSLKKDRVEIGGRWDTLPLVFYFPVLDTFFPYRRPSQSSSPIFRVYKSEPGGGAR